MCRLLASARGVMCEALLEQAYGVQGIRSTVVVGVIVRRCVSAQAMAIGSADIRESRASPHGGSG